MTEAPKRAQLYTPVVSFYLKHLKEKIESERVILKTSIYYDISKRYLKDN